MHINVDIIIGLCLVEEKRSKGIFPKNELWVGFTQFIEYLASN
jgi:hypothetical protein